MNKKIIAGIMSVAMLATMSATPILAEEVRTAVLSGNQFSFGVGTTTTTSLPEDKTYPSQDAGQTTTLKAEWNKQYKTLTFSSSKQDGEELTQEFVNEAYTNIGLSAEQFGENGTFNVVIGDGITAIGICAFSDTNALLNQKISSVKVSDNNSLTEIKNLAFNTCNSLETADFSKCKNLTNIGYGAFRSSNLSAVSCGNSATSGAIFNSKIKKIGEEAFARCKNITTVDFSQSELKEIGQYAFYDTALKTINFKNCQELITINSSAFANGYPHGKSNLETADFSGCTKLEIIGQHAFGGVYPVVDITGVTNDLSEQRGLTNIIIKKDKDYTVKGFVTLNQNLTIGNTEKLTILANAKLTVPAGKTLTNNGMVENNGKIDNKGTIKTEGTGAKTENNGTINNEKTFEIGEDAEMTNDGALNNKSTGTLTNKGTLTNNKTMTNEGTLTNNKRMTNKGTLTNKKTVTNLSNAVIDNKGTIKTEGADAKTENNGTVNNNSGASITTGEGAITNNNGTINAYEGGTITGKIKNSTGTVITTSPTDIVTDYLLKTNEGYTVQGGVKLPGTLTIDQGKTLTIPETMTLTVLETGTLSNNGTILCNGTLNGKGKFYKGAPTADNIIVPSTITESMIYNGNPYAQATDFKLGTVKEHNVTWEFPGWTGSLTKDGKPVTEIKDAGTYTITFSKEGKTSVTKTFTVNSAEITGELKPNAELTYNGNAQTPEVSGLTSVNTQKLNIKYCTTQNGTYGTMPTFTDAGTYTVYYKATALNHSEKTGHFIFKIKQKAITIDAKDQNITYAENPTIQTGIGQVTVSELAGNDALTGITLTANSELTEVIASEGVIKNSDSDVTKNYAITYNKGKLTRVSDWNNPTYEWKQQNGNWICTATRTDKNNENKQETANATVTDVQSKAPTCTEKGETTYTAKFNEEWAAEQTKTVADINALGHKWSNPTYEWSTDGKTCSAKRVCEHDKTHIEIANTTVTKAQSKAPTCTEKGETTYTATFTETWAAEQTKTVVDIDALGHEWGEPVFTFSEDSTTATAKQICQHDKTHTKSIEENVTVTSEITTPATCSVKGTTTYTAKVTLNGQEKTATTTRQDVALNPESHNNQLVKVDAQPATCTADGTKEHWKCEGCGKLYSDETATKELTLEEVTTEKATGHKWGELVITFAEDGKSATSMVICQNDENHFETPTAVITSTVKTPATTSTKGTTTYTATVLFEGKNYTATKDVQDIPEIGSGNRPDIRPNPNPTPTPDITVDTSADDFAEGGNVTISGFNGVPDELKMKYGSVRNMKKYTEQAIAEYFEKTFKSIKFNAENTVFFNAELKPDADGKIYLPVPKNVDAAKNKFVVAHIMDNGDIEVVEGKVTEKEIEVELNGLSPVMITWFSSDLAAGEGMVEVEESL